MSFVKSDLCVAVQAKSVMVVEVTAPAWLHRFIIGKKGQNIGRITQQLPRVGAPLETRGWRSFGFNVLLVCVHTGSHRVHGW